jgi:hypothetical protein
MVNEAPALVDATVVGSIDVMFASKYGRVTTELDCPKS